MDGSRRSVRFKKIDVRLGNDDDDLDDFIENTGECWRLASLSQPNTPHFCRSCMWGFRDRIQLNNHLKQHYVESRGLASTNTQGFKDVGSDEDTSDCWRLASLSKPHLTTPHFCRSCMLGFRDRILLNNHLKRHYVESRGLTRVTTTTQDDTSVNNGQQEEEQRGTRSSNHDISDSCQADETSWQCYMCDQVLPDKKQLNTHFASAHRNAKGGRKGVCCPHCRLVFDYTQDLIVHIGIDHEIDRPRKRPGRKPNEMYITVACECGKIFVNELDYQEHILDEHPGTEPLKWPKDLSDLKRKRQSDVGQYQTKRKKGGTPSKAMNNSNYYNAKQDGVAVSCIECGETFAVAMELKRHMQHDHNIHLKPHSCTICGRRFTKKSEVKLHVEKNHLYIRVHDPTPRKSKKKRK